MKLHMDHIERASLNATLLIRRYKIFTRPYMEYACTALPAPNKTQREKLDVIQSRKTLSSLYEKSS